MYEDYDMDYYYFLNDLKNIMEYGTIDFEEIEKIKKEKNLDQK